MRSPKKMLHLQIDITNACDKRCSNCTRFCGNYKKPFFMNFDTFKRAVDSLKGFGGTYGIIGGEPTLHPQFERFVRYVASKFGPLPVATKQLIYPQKDFIRTMHSFEFENRSEMEVDGESLFRTNGPGLWSNMGASYKKYYEVISDCFCVQYLNDHMNPSFHQPGLLARKDLGIPDEQWIKLRDACWVQNEWSTTITPKGAFFCEVAGALDMLFDGPGGWPIEPGWWKREPEDFGDQLKWCELCGFALNTFTRDSDEEIDDVSPTMYEMLKKIGSPKLKSGRINVVKIENGVIAEDSKKENKRFSPGMPYIEHYEDRFNALNSVLFAHEYEAAVIPDGDGFGGAFNKLLESSEEWIVLHSANAKLTGDFSEQMGKYVLNPGTLHVLDLSKSNDTRFVQNADSEHVGYAALFSKNAISLREFGFDRIAHTKSFAEIASMWQPHKVVELSGEIDRVNQFSRISKDVKYAIWGTGSAGSAAFDAIKGAGGKVVIAVDKNSARQGCDFYGMTIQPPAYLPAHADEFDVLVAANYTRFAEIGREAVAMGIDESKVQYINRLVFQKTENPCPVCKSGDIEISDGIAHCHSCGHEWRTEMLGVRETIEAKYRRADYFQQDKSHQGVTNVAFSDEWADWLDLRIKLLNSFHLFSHEDPGSISVFEVGCLEGMLLHEYKKRGYKVLGNDVCEITEEAQKSLGITILTEPIEELHIDQRFDLIMSFYAMEHFVDPDLVMKKMVKLAKPNGKIFLHVPVDDKDYGNEDHYHFFSSDSIRYLMRKYTRIIKEESTIYPTSNGNLFTAMSILGQVTGDDDAT